MQRVDAEDTKVVFDEHDMSLLGPCREELEKTRLEMRNVLADTAKLRERFSEEMTQCYANISEMKELFREEMVRCRTTLTGGTSLAPPFWAIDGPVEGCDGCGKVTAHCANSPASMSTRLTPTASPSPSSKNGRPVFSTRQSPAVSTRSEVMTPCSSARMLNNNIVVPLQPVKHRHAGRFVGAPRTNAAASAMTAAAAVAAAAAANPLPSSALLRDPKIVLYPVL